MSSGAKWGIASILATIAMTGLGLALAEQLNVAVGWSMFAFGLLGLVCLFVFSEWQKIRRLRFRWPLYSPNSAAAMKLLTIATPLELTGSFIQNKTFRISELADADNTVKGKTFEGCHIFGPAILRMDNVETLKGCTFHDRLDHVLITLLPRQPGTCGTIMLKDCHFRDCHFRHLGFIGHWKEVDAWMVALTHKAEEPNS